MKIIIEQKDVGRVIDFDTLRNIDSPDVLNSVIGGMEIFSGKSTPEESIKMYGHNVIGETLSGAPVTIKKERKKPGPKKGSRKKKNEVVRFTKEQLKEELNKTHPEFANLIQS